jgi:hypothetical protein
MGKDFIHELERTSEFIGRDPRSLQSLRSV